MSPARKLTRSVMAELHARLETKEDSPEAVNATIDFPKKCLLTAAYASLTLT
jgi:hypothetical protein